MSEQRPKYPLRPSELIGKSVLSEKNGCIVDEDGAIIIRGLSYEDAESVALVMNHVEAVWAPRFAALEKRMSKTTRMNS